MDVPEMPPETILRKVERAIDGFTVPLPHRVRPVPPSLFLQPFYQLSLFLFQPWLHITKDFILAQKIQK